MILQGAFVAIVTPFDNGAVDEKALRRHVDFMIDNGIDGIVPCGTTGEAVTLSDDEKVAVVRITKSQVRGRVPIIAGAGSNATAHAVHLSKLMKEVGVDALLHVTPYYNKPTQEGLFQHFSAVAKATDLPVILYNVPGRTAVDMQAETVARLAKTCPTIVGDKECAGIDRVKTIRETLGKSFQIFSGEDALNAELYSKGANGAISVAGNVAPQLVSQVWDAAAAGNWDEAVALQEKLQALNQILFIESNPIPVKTALAMMGHMREEFRLPLCEMRPDTRDQLQKVLHHYNLC